MLLRAAFWIGIIAMLMPREPDLGYGPPGPNSEMFGSVAHWLQSRLPDSPPAADSARFTPSSSVVLVNLAGRDLAQVKAEIAAARQNGQ